jgi:hypothetical protein
MTAWPADDGNLVIVVAHDAAAADRLAAALAGWAKATAGGRRVGGQRWTKLTADLGLALGYPPLAIEAFLDLRPALRAASPPWSALEIAWWRKLRMFVPAADESGLAEARAWLSRARSAFERAYPDARPPVPANL